jgi:hypothetical protein
MLALSKFKLHPLSSVLTCTCMLLAHRETQLRMRIQSSFVAFHVHFQFGLLLINHVVHCADVPIMLRTCRCIHTCSSVSARVEMSSVRMIHDRCAICDAVEDKPHVSLSRCQTHFELRCQHCMKRGKHATPPPPNFSNANRNETSFIDKLIQEKEVDGVRYVLARWKDSWIPHSDVQTADASLSTLADVANDIGNAHACLHP